MKSLSINAKVFVHAILIALLMCLIEIILFFGFDIQISKYDFSWKITPLKFAFLTFGMWLFLSYVYNKQSEFEVEQNYHRRRGKAAVERQRAEDEGQKYLMKDPNRFRRINHRVN